jgi:uncharacterized protein YggU (UPF0235/DUF167 family)
MIIEVLVKPGAKKNEVSRTADGCFKVFVKEKAMEGKANEAVRELLADHFDVSKSRVVFLHGLKSKIKRIEIL